MVAVQILHGALRAFGLMALFSATLGTVASAASRPQPRQIVVRVSRDAVAPIADKQIDRTTPVEDVILGTRVRGQARTTGKPAVQFIEDPHQATFAVALKGATVSRTVGRNGPAIIHSRVDTNFNATTQIRFEPGKGFVAQPAKIATTTRMTNEGIGSRRGGLIGWVVRRRATREVAASRGEVEQIARQKAERRITAAFDEFLESRLARLNQMTDMKPAMALLLGGDRQPEFATRTTRDFVEIALSSAGTPMPVDLPVNEQPGAPVQVWVHRSTMGEQLATVLKLFDQTDTGTNLAERALASVPDMLKDKFGLPQTAGEARPPLNYQTSADWIVLQIGGEAISAGKPALASDQPRLWTSADGRHSCFAVRVSTSPEAVTLKRMVDGEVVTVPLVKLSETDRQIALR
jgi:hypothetical protein